MKAIRHQRSVVSRATHCHLRLRALCAIGIALGHASTVMAAEDNEFLLIRRSMDVQTIRLSAITDLHVEHLPADRSWERVPLGECIALLNPSVDLRTHMTGLIVLADGQRIPGEYAAGAKAEGDVLAWTHPWLGRIDVPLNAIETVSFAGSSKPPPPGQRDVVLLANGDAREGLIVSIGETLSMEVDRAGTPQIVDIRMDLVAAITMVATRRPSAAATRRVWFEEGTVIDAQSISVGEDGFVRLGGSSLMSGTQPTRVGLSQIAAILLDSRGMVPLATLTPTRVEGPATRYVLPKPVALNPGAPLGLSAMEYSGPLVARYAVPQGGQRFVAEAVLPKSAQLWGDYELVIRSDDREVFRTRLNATSPTAAINVVLVGRELTIEIIEGENGPIQDRVVLNRPMILMKR